MATTGVGAITVGDGVGTTHGYGTAVGVGTLAGAGDGTILGDTTVGAGVGTTVGAGMPAGAGPDMAGAGVTHTTAGAITDIMAEIMHTCRAEEDIHEFQELLCAQEIATTVILEETVAVPIQRLPIEAIIWRDEATVLTPIVQIHSDIQGVLQLLETKTTEPAEALDLRLVIIIETVEQPVLHTEPTHPTEAQEATVEPVDRAQEAIPQATEEPPIVPDHTQVHQEAVVTADLRHPQEVQAVTAAAALLPEVLVLLEVLEAEAQEVPEVPLDPQAVHVVEVEAEVEDHNILKTISLI